MRIRGKCQCLKINGQSTAFGAGWLLVIVDVVVDVIEVMANEGT